MVRATLKQLQTEGQIGSNKQFIYKGQEISVVYFRAGYTPRDYPSQTEWDAVLKLERTKAIKCPCVAYHLAGSKKVQQVLANKNVLKKFCNDEEMAQLTPCFAGLWGLEKEDEATKKVINDAIKNNDDYVLKPQREGGGNNLYHEEMAQKLKTANFKELSAFILMQKIKPRPQPACLIRKAEMLQGECLSEFGIFSAFLGDGKKTEHNELCGHLVRTKFVGVDEGGVASGFSCLSSPMLV